MTDIAGAFEIAVLLQLALASALIMFVAAGSVDARGAQRIFVLMGVLNGSLLLLQVSWLRALRFGIAVGGIPAALVTLNYLMTPMVPTTARKLA